MDMRLTDEQWAIVQSLIPSKRRPDGRGRPRVPSRMVLEGVLWVLWTGAPWKALPSDYPPYQTCHRRFQEWVSTATRLWAPRIGARVIYVDRCHRIYRISSANNVDQAISRAYRSQEPARAWHG